MTAIDKYKPRNVVFYSKTYLKDWQKIVGVDFIEVDGLHIAEEGSTSYICTLHPAAQIKGGKGVKFAYWQKVGDRLASR